MNNYNIEAIQWGEITHLNKLKEIEESWYALNKSSSVGTIFSSPAWLLEWISTFWQPTWSLHVITGYIDKNLVILVPLYLQSNGNIIKTKTLFPIGQGEPEYEEVSTEYLDILIDDRISPENSYQLIAQKIKKLPFNQLKWYSVLEDAHWLAVFKLISKRLPNLAGKRYLIENIDGDIDNFNKSTKKQWKRKSNKLPESFVFKWALPSEYPKYWNKLSELHQLRWQNKNKPGAFSSIKFNEFHHNLQLNLQAKTIKISVLLIENKAAAINYYFHYDNTFYFYQSGWDESLAQYSPGLLLHIWSALHTDDEKYDLMMGTTSSTYKQKICNNHVNMYNTEIKSTFEKIISLLKLRRFSRSLSPKLLSSFFILLWI